MADDTGDDDDTTTTGLVAKDLRPWYVRLWRKFMALFGR